MPALHEEDYACCYTAAPRPRYTVSAQPLHSSTGDLYHPTAAAIPRPATHHHHLYHHQVLTPPSGSPPLSVMPPGGYATYHPGMPHHRQPPPGAVRPPPPPLVHVRLPAYDQPPDYYQQQHRQMVRAVRLPYPPQLQVHLMATRGRSDSPQRGSPTTYGAPLPTAAYSPTPYLVATRGTQTLPPPRFVPPPPLTATAADPAVQQKVSGVGPRVGAGSSSSSCTSSPTRPPKQERRPAPEGCAAQLPPDAAPGPPPQQQPPAAAPATAVYYAMNV